MRGIVKNVVTTYDVIVRNVDVTYAERRKILTKRYFVMNVIYRTIHTVLIHLSPIWMIFLKMKIGKKGTEENRLQVVFFINIKMNAIRTVRREKYDLQYSLAYVCSALCSMYVLAHS